MSGLSTYLEELFYPDFVMVVGILPALYGDSIYQNTDHSTLLARFSITPILQGIEHMYRQLFYIFDFLKQPHMFALIHDTQAAYINSSKQLRHFKLLYLFE
jgi:hypothetical protein